MALWVDAGVLVTRNSTPMLLLPQLLLAFTYSRGSWVEPEEEAVP